MQQIIICRPLSLFCDTYSLHCYILFKLIIFFINKLFLHLSYILCPFLQFLHILFYFTTIFFLYNYSSTQNINFLIPDDAIHTLIGKRLGFDFYLRSERSHLYNVYFQTYNVLLKGNMNRSSNILILSSHIKHCRLHAFICNTYKVLSHEFCYITQIKI